MVGVREVERRTEQLFEVRPVGEGDVVVGQDGFDGNAVKHPPERSRELLLRAVREQLNERSFTERIDRHQQYGFAAAFRRADNEV